MNKNDRYLVTGGQGFLGAWILKRLLEAGAQPIVLDLKPDDSILEQVLKPQELERLERVHGDVVDADFVARTLATSRARRVIHLAGLQIPSCRAQPLLGARVNVLGTLNVFEAARQCAGQVQSIVYASSAAVSGRVEDYAGPIADEAQHFPRTLYGVYKTANEGCARVYWLDHGIPSVGLRPLAVYGVGREVGVTSGPTKAIKAALLGRRYTIGFSGQTAFNYVEDAAQVFIAASQAVQSGAAALNMRGEFLTVEEFVRGIEDEVPAARGTITATGGAIPVAYDFLEAGLERLIGVVPHTPVREGIRRTAEHFRALQASGRLHDRDLSS